jgi:hypothetical protein
MISNGARRTGNFSKGVTGKSIIRATRSGVKTLAFDASLALDGARFALPVERNT